MARDQGPRERLIAAAIDLVREKGVEGAGLTELLERSGAARRSIYQHFPEGKHALVVTATESAGRWIRRVLRDMGSTMATSELLVWLMEQMKTNLRESEFRLGCPIAAAALAPADAMSVRAAAGSIFVEWAGEIQHLLERDGHSEESARSLAGFAVSAIEGALLTAQATRSNEPLDQVVAQLERLLLLVPADRSG